ncbi:hypothetical protein BDV38DRAFT_269241 [Aspergillus pseudotamarii]|uniref:Uncharacterized protein n=1 Tax=Aspergillus pseudotamarii TaxID=132259 RepID=A0A5N6T1S0_ASPPS|nr:uncharacterized protein BDV38DRAFT_269241 [Aspergillus pseudotamarii]KAE8140237.1 hypothetical protein BDV38DRAFT_269241 [Aspergillus pseudotamarii]
MPSAVNKNGPTYVPQPAQTGKASEPDFSICGPLFAAAQNGDLDRINEILDKDPKRIDDQCEKHDKYTPVIVAAVSGKLEAVQLLCKRGANVNLRDSNSYTIIKLTLDKGYEDIANWLVDAYPDMIITDPRLPKGAEWLKAQFAKISNNIKDEASKPPKSVLEQLLSGNLKPDTDRTVSEVYWEHILLRYIGDIPKDIERNYSKKLKMAFCGTFDRTLQGHEGIKESARLLNSVLPTTQYNITGTHVAPKGQWVTERWEYHDYDNNLQVLDGVDTFLINEEKGKIEVMLINYNVYELKWIDDPERPVKKTHNWTPV